MIYNNQLFYIIPNLNAWLVKKMQNILSFYSIPISVKDKYHTSDIVIMRNNTLLIIVVNCYT